jgi:hypothetical protein
MPGDGAAAMKIAIHIDGTGSGASSTRIAMLQARLLGTIRQRLAAEAARDDQQPQPRKAR